MILASGQQGNKLFDELSAFQPCFFLEFLADFDGDFGGFDENATYSDWESYASDPKNIFNRQCAPEKSTNFIQNQKKYSAYCTCL